MIIDTLSNSEKYNSVHPLFAKAFEYIKSQNLATIEDGKLYGLGSNDAGGCLVSLLMAFLHFYDNENLNYNLVYAATAEEEISGANGIQEALQRGGIGFRRTSPESSPRFSQAALVKRMVEVLESPSGHTYTPAGAPLGLPE